MGLERNRSWIVPAMLTRAVQKAMNSQLRIDTVKVNPTVRLKQSIAITGNDAHAM